MNNDLLLLIKQYTDTLINQTKNRSQETLEFRMIKQMQSFQFNPSINLSSENCLLSVTSFEATISVFIQTNENNLFSITLTGHWVCKSAEKLLMN